MHSERESVPLSHLGVERQVAANVQSTLRPALGFRWPNCCFIPTFTFCQGVPGGKLPTSGGSEALSLWLLFFCFLQLSRLHKIASKEHPLHCCWTVLFYEVFTLIAWQKFWNNWNASPWGFRRKFFPFETDNCWSDDILIIKGHHIFKKCNPWIGLRRPEHTSSWSLEGPWVTHERTTQSII